MNYKALNTDVAWIETLRSNFEGAAVVAMLGNELTLAVGADATGDDSLVGRDRLMECGVDPRDASRLVACVALVFFKL